MLFLGPFFVPEALEEREPAKVMLTLGGWGMEFRWEGFVEEEGLETMGDGGNSDGIGVEFFQVLG